MMNMSHNFSQHANDVSVNSSISTSKGQGFKRATKEERAVKTLKTETQERLIKLCEQAEKDYHAQKAGYRILYNQSKAKTNEFNQLNDKRQAVLIELKRKAVIYEGNNRGYNQLLDMLGIEDSEEVQDDSSDSSRSLGDEDYEEDDEEVGLQSYSTNVRYKTTEAAISHRSGGSLALNGGKTLFSTARANVRRKKLAKLVIDDKDQYMQIDS